jgi:hypothetical protein
MPPRRPEHAGKDPDCDRAAPGKLTGFLGGGDRLFEPPRIPIGEGEKDIGPYRIANAARSSSLTRKMTF